MKTITFELTSDDLIGKPNNAVDCPFFRALQRKIPSLIAVLTYRIVITIQREDKNWTWEKTPLPENVSQAILNLDVRGIIPPKGPYTIEIPDSVETSP